MHNGASGENEMPAESRNTWPRGEKHSQRNTGNFNQDGNQKPALADCRYLAGRMRKALKLTAS